MKPTNTFLTTKKPLLHYPDPVTDTLSCSWNIRKTPNLLFGFFCAFLYFFHFFQVKKVNFEKVWAAWEKPSPLLFHVLIFHFFITTLLFSHDITETTPIVSSTFPNKYVCQ